MTIFIIYCDKQKLWEKDISEVSRKENLGLNSLTCLKFYTK